MSVSSKIAKGFCHVCSGLVDPVVSTEYNVFVVRVGVEKSDEELEIDAAMEPTTSMLESNDRIAGGCTERSNLGINESILTIDYTPDAEGQRQKRRVEIPKAIGENMILSNRPYQFSFFCWCFFKLFKPVKVKSTQTPTLYWPVSLDSRKFERCLDESMRTSPRKSSNEIVPQEGFWETKLQSSLVAGVYV